MKELFIRLFISNWPRKALALLFASTSWFLVNRSLNENQVPPLQLQETIALQAIHDELLPLEVKLPLVFVSPATDHECDKPLSIEISPSDLIEKKNGFYFLKTPLLVGGASPLFISIVKEKLALMLYLTSDEESHLNWSIELTDQRKLEESYINACFAKGGDHASETTLRNHFRSSIHQLSLFTEKKKPFQMSATQVGNTIHIKLKK